MTTNTRTRPVGTGVIIPVCTPLGADDDIDTASLRRHLDHLIAGGVHGVFVLGTSGEFGFLTDRQRELVVRTTVDQVAGRVPVLVGISDMASERAIEQAHLLIPLGADAVVATAPFFAATGHGEMLTHFRRIKQAAGDVPVYGYENPPRVNDTSIPVDVVLDLAADGTFAGFKDSSGDLEYLRAILAGRAARRLSNFHVLSGSETDALAALRAGADGLVPGLGNIDPAGYVSLMEHALCDGDRAQKEQERLQRLFSIVEIPTHTPMGGSSRALGAFKTAIKQLGHFADDRCAPPSVLFDDADRSVVAEILAAHGPSAGLTSGDSWSDARSASTERS
ncbi:dihydrodipicolinate synthase family protein [Brachybacterium sp. p3-SID957]|uniref:dihydrodipicolinate synthase family protein n=1 Tax=Brachybacterium sp. p3-SID957 TaxID=2916049 RepID=UPI00223B02CF|nr:dihydrodipicolinate synthase family protein [Brachybacterium sp. p3-SID957]MCT1776280.1 dihydrodipicolinate synthase family protein [Brachybacterium sp. p3-SID957]